MSEPVSGIFSSLRRLGDSLIGAVKDHAELLAVELQEEKLRLIQIFLWISAAVFSGMLAIAFFSLTVVFLCPPEHRALALAIMTVLYLGASVAIIAAVRRRIAHQPNPFAATIREITRDRECLEPDK